MPGFTLLGKLHRTGLLTGAGLWRLAAGLWTTGVNLMVLLYVAARLHPQRAAITDDREQVTYARLWARAETLAYALHRQYGVGRGQQVAIVCRNHAAAIQTIFAAARTGAHVALLNPELSADRLQALHAQMRFDFVVYDEPLAPVFAEAAVAARAISADQAEAIALAGITAAGEPARRLPRCGGGRIVVLTGGTTGAPKAASRRPSLLAYLPPFLALLDQAHLDRCRSIYIATPLSHGYGLAFLFIAAALGLEMHFAARFVAASACARIASQQIQAAVLVPLMLQRMLVHDPAALAPLVTVITGSAPLTPALAAAALTQLGPRLYNLYGTSEAGFSILATPALLSCKPAAIGRPLPGVAARVIAQRASPARQAAAAGAVGPLCIRSAWTVHRQRWIETGDLAYVDADGDIFLCGRVDDMIVSGGENVYPQDVEQIIAQHPAVDAVAVAGIPDAEFGQRLKAVVVLRPGAVVDAPALLAWLKPRVARYQMPAAVEFRAELPYTAIGKVDRRQV